MHFSGFEHTIHSSKEILHTETPEHYTPPRAAAKAETLSTAVINTNVITHAGENDKRLQERNIRTFPAATPAGLEIFFSRTKSNASHALLYSQYRVYTDARAHSRGITKGCESRAD